MFTCRYVTSNQRISFEDTTKLNMEAEEEQNYLEQRRASQQGTSSSNSPGTAGGGSSAFGFGATAAKNGPSYHFICECFFLTAKGLHLGLIKAITDATELHRVLFTSPRTKHQFVVTKHPGAVSACTISVQGHRIITCSCCLWPFNCIHIIFVTLGCSLT